MAQKRDSLQYFLEHAGNVPLLTPAEEIELSRKVQAYLPLRDLYGPLSKQERRTLRLGERAFNRMLMANLRLIVYMAAKQRVNDRGILEMNDMVQEGVFGLMRAVEKFDPSRGYRFSTYAYAWIRQAIGRAMQTHDRHIYLPSTQYQYLGHIDKLKVKYKMELGRLPTVDEIVDECNAHYKNKTNAEAITALLALANDCHSLDAPLKKTEDGETSWVDMIADETDVWEQLETQSHIDKVQDALKDLDEQQRTAIELHYGLNGHVEHTKHQVSHAMEIGIDQARSLGEKGKRSLRNKLRNYVRQTQVVHKEVSPDDETYWHQPELIDLFRFKAA